MRSRHLLFYTVVYIVMSQGCTISEPEIIELVWQINHRHDIESGKKTEELSFWAHVRDDDGDDDIESFYLVHDASELYFRLQADNWDQELIGEELWIGHGGLRMYRAGSFPRGAYRIIVVDRAGERAEESIYVSSDRVSPEDTEYPRLSVSGGEIAVSSAYNRNTLWFWDGSSAIVKRLATSSVRIPLSGALNRQERERTVGVSVYSYDDDHGIGAIAGVYALE